MRKSTKIILVAAAAVLLCAFLLLGALYLEDSGYWAEQPDPKTDREDSEEPEDREKEEEEENENGGGDEQEETPEPGGEAAPGESQQPGDEPVQPEPGPEQPEAAALDIRMVDLTAPEYPVVELYCEIYYQGTADFAAGLPLDIFRVTEVTADGENECRILSVSQLTASASPVKGDCYLITAEAGGGALESDVLLELWVESERYVGMVQTSLAQVIPPEEEPKPDDSYVAVQADLTWEEAAAVCEEMGGHLAAINSEAEYHQLIALAEAADLKVFWAGARIENIEDDWAEAQWITGAPITFTDWYPGEPNKETEDELCLMVFCVDGIWYYNDAPNHSNQYYTGKIGFICELEPTE